jgi:hypothetical protein
VDLLIISLLSCLNFFVIYRFIAPLYGFNEMWGQVVVYDNNRVMSAVIFFAGTASVLMMAFPRTDLTIAVIAAGLVIDCALFLLPRIFKFRW